MFDEELSCQPFYIPTSDSTTRQSPPHPVLPAVQGLYYNLRGCSSGYWPGSGNASDKIPDGILLKWQPSTGPGSTDCSLFRQPGSRRFILEVTRWKIE